MRKNRSIAIDGDSGSGKSTVGKLVAEKLGYEFVDSGLLYRAATFVIISDNLSEEKNKWVNLIENTSFDLKNGTVIINGKKISIEDLRNKRVDSLVSPVSTVKEVRDSVNRILKNIAHSRDVVMVGRDIGSVVFKDAFLKIYLTATIHERANRRFKELIKKGVKTSFEEVFENLKKRDTIDSSRDIAPLTVPNDAYVIDTTNLTVEEVVNRIMQFIRGKEYAL
jgi:cytidylate kinase